MTTATPDSQLVKRMWAIYYDNLGVELNESRFLFPFVLFTTETEALEQFPAHNRHYKPREIWVYASAVGQQNMLPLSDAELRDPEYMRAYVESANDSFSTMMAELKKARSQLAALKPAFYAMELAKSLPTDAWDDTPLALRRAIMDIYNALDGVKQVENSIPPVVQLQDRKIVQEKDQFYIVNWQDEKVLTPGYESPEEAKQNHEDIFSSVKTLSIEVGSEIDPTWFPETD